MNPDKPLDQLLAEYYEDLLVVLAHRAGHPMPAVEFRAHAAAALHRSAVIIEAMAGEMPALAHDAAGVTQ